MAEVEAEVNNNSLQEEYLKSFENIEEGQLIVGTVIQITDESVFIDVGYKSEGKIPIEEFKEKPEMGATVEVVLVKKEGKSGEVVVSKKKADVKGYWKDLRVAFQDKTPVEGKIIKAIKGGFEVDLNYDIIGFLPFSKADISRIENPEELVGVESKFLIERLYSDNKAKIVVSRRGFLENEMVVKREEFYNKITIDDEVEGVVKSFTSFGAFIDLGGFDGLLHINDMSWGHVTKPKDFVKRGDKIKVKVIKLDKEENRINLSLKHFTNDPWTIFDGKYNVDDVVKGKVTKLADFGAFIEIEEGIEGLAHVSELSWVKRIKHPKEVLSIGDDVEIKILSYDLESKRVSLGIKQTLPNPWDELEKSYPVGKKIKQPVVKITNAGVFINLEEGIDGFLHADDISWTKKGKKTASQFNVGDEVETVVTAIDKEARRIRLGIKQLSEDPWETLAKTYKKKSLIEGEITNVTDFGIFVKVPGGIEGLINKNNCIAPGIEIEEDEILSKFKAGDKVKAVVVEINRKTQRLSMSIKDYLKGIQREELSKYIHNDKGESSTYTLGDMLKQKGQDN